MRLLKSFGVFTLAILNTTSSIAEEQWIRLFSPASNTVQQGFIRVTNTGNTTGPVEIFGLDDSGQWGANSVSFTLGPRQSLHLNSSDLENGNSSKGITSALGSGTGQWQLLISSSLKLDALGLMRTPSGFMTSVHATSSSDYGLAHTVNIFNPGSNTAQASKLRLINASEDSNTFTILGIDDKGLSPGSDVKITLAPLSSIELNGQDLEQGNSSKNLTGGLGDGSGKWRLEVTSSSASVVMSLLEASGGYLSNLSTVTNTENEFINLSCSDIEGASLYSQETRPVYLGFIGSAHSINSINNSNLDYGSQNFAQSVHNTASNYGSAVGSFSAASASALQPPIAVKNGKILFYLTTNANLDVATFSLATLSAACTFTSQNAAQTFLSPN